jgi:Mlc titration factor MtfA (ptsG expression regulator)
MFETRRHRMRRERLEAGFLAEWRELLDRRMAHWQMLDENEKARLEQVALGLIAEKRWEAAQGFELSDEIMVTIAASAALLILGLPDDSYRGVGTIIVHPTTIAMTGERSTVPGLVSDAPMSMLGEAHYQGPVLIVWDAAREAARHPQRGHNVVYHEFAHKLDMLDGTVDGTPPLATQEEVDRWVGVCTEVYDRVREGSGSAVLRSYGGVNSAEFFAVATEAFFDQPRQLQDHERRLYEVLSDYYRQDPVAREQRAARSGRPG